MLLEAFGWRFLFKILRFPLRFDALHASKGVVQQAAYFWHYLGGP